VPTGKGDQRGDGPVLGQGRCIWNDDKDTANLRNGRDQRGAEATPRRGSVR
jgi:hypothetical protein